MQLIGVVTCSHVKVSGFKMVDQQHGKVKYVVAYYDRKTMIIL